MAQPLPQLSQSCLAPSGSPGLREELAPQASPIEESSRVTSTLFSPAYTSQSTLHPVSMRAASD